MQGLFTILLSTLVLSAEMVLRLVLLDDAHQHHNRQKLEFISTVLRPEITEKINQDKQEDIRQLLENTLNSLPLALIAIRERSPSPSFPAIELRKTQGTIQPGLEYIDMVTTEKGVFNLILQVEHQQFDASYHRYLGLNRLLDIAGYLLLATALYYFVRRGVLRRVKQLHQRTRYLDLNNQTDIVIQQKGWEEKDEFNFILESFNRMRRALIDDLDQRRAIELALISEKQEKLATRKLIQETEAASRAKNHFIATMSHEIRTPMNGVIGMVEMLRDTPLNDSQRHYIEVIYRSGESLVSIINDILDYSKIEAGKMDLEKVEFSLTDLIDDCLQLFSASTQKRGIELLGHIAADSPNMVVGDPTRLRQIIVNLIGNAFKFTSHGYVLLQVTLEESFRSNTAQLCFSVQDSGIGIEGNLQKSLFEAFSQADSSTTRRFGGTGLGLAICKQLVEIMDGEIGVDSQPGKGSDFWFSIPLKLPESSKQLPASCSLALSKKSLHLAHSASFFGDILSQYSANWNLSCEQSKTPQETLYYLQQRSTPYDFFLLSQELGSADGLALAKKIRAIPCYDETPILLLTNEPSSSFTLEDLMPITAIVTRPVTMHHLLETLVNQSAGIGLDELISVPEEVKNNTQTDINVLVAEDNPVNRLVVEGLLSKFDINPKFAENGLEALDAVTGSNAHFDVIFMDCEMPKMDGFEAALKIRQLENNKSLSPTPIIALTAHVEAEHRQRVFSSGMNYYLSKPVTLEKLKESLVSVGVM